MFEVRTYAGTTKYVPEWLGNREAWKKNQPFFYVDVLPLNDTEFQSVHQAAKGTDDAQAQDFKIIETRIPAIYDLQFTGNNGTVLTPKKGADLLNGVRENLDNTRFVDLCRELVLAAIKHSVLSEGELKGSSSSPE